MSRSDAEKKRTRRTVRFFFYAPMVAFGIFQLTVIIATTK